ncbi:MAG: glucosylceramidase [Ignavibacteriales bacterium]|nr:glucosylceramidase [Ignavibacteriales bacterium]MCB9210681.1 glucosylceramidase [Ignavibacteriales bacterium]MCB9219642.1 glucosylceramidase [Ignavibacteriales bacterium]MCB9259970.1 glucosylceramidase [Ignavibacteriales bacterium]
MKKLTLSLILVLLVSIDGCGQNVNEPSTNNENKVVKFWLTDASKGIKFQQQFNNVDTGRVSNETTIKINNGFLGQFMDGFGFALTGGSAKHIHNMSTTSRSKLLTELFDVDDSNIGISYLRVSIGASDLDEYVFSYNDLSTGETDVNMEKFSLSEDRKHLIPVLKEILNINPNIKIMGSPWSAPTWMKTNNNSIGGSLKSIYYDAYAKYFVKYIQSMTEEGITIDAITVQNEPLHGGNNPSMVMQPNEQATFIKNNLGPMFNDSGINTKIIIYDHNADRTDYPITVLNDPMAKQYIDGTAFHLYGGTIDDLSLVHNAHPDRNLYFTEQWIGAPGNFEQDIKWHVRELIIGATRNWCKNVIEWNLAADENQEPHTPGGCDRCLGALTITGNQVTRNPAYYVIAHASKFVRPGSQRVYSSVSIELPNVAFNTSENQYVIIVLNDTNEQKSFNISIEEKVINSTLSSGAVGTYIWDIEN